MEGTSSSSGTTGPTPPVMEIVDPNVEVGPIPDAEEVAVAPVEVIQRTPEQEREEYLQARRLRRIVAARRARRARRVQRVRPNAIRQMIRKLEREGWMLRDELLYYLSSSQRRRNSRT